VNVPDYSAAIAACLGAGLAWFSNRRLVGWLPDDVPGAGRKQHRRPTPLAGIALLPVLVGWLLLGEDWWLAGAAAIAGFAGWLDDRGKALGRELSWRTKTLLLLLAAALAANACADPAGEPQRWLLAIGLAFVLANATNFLDNTDGVCCALSAASLLLLGGDTAACGWAALGFLPWNWPWPLLFTGDCGALALGIVAGAAASRAAAGDVALLLAVSVQLADFVQVVTARLCLGLPPWVGDRRHLTHIAMNLGVPRWLVAPLFAGALLGLTLWLGN
jgi:UDP-N-acetylmuramyl pentapeptide phosphotransferase/UDP-N-acetylglucosamine-1-phosphate transferase